MNADPVASVFNEKSQKQAGSAKPTPKYPPPYLIRFTAAEKSWLKKQAGEQPVSTFIRNVVLNDETAPRRGKCVARV